METILIILAFLSLLTGFLGSIIPIMPGPPLSFVGLLLLQWSGYGGFSSTFLWVWAGITVIVTIADNFFPAWMARRFGGSHLAMTGSLLGLVIGMFIFPPVGLIIGPFLGSLAGELIHDRTDGTKALKVALGAFLAFILGTGVKLIVCSVMIYYAVEAIFK